MTIKDLFLKAKTMGASDLHITAGLPPVLRIHGRLKQLEGQALNKEDTRRLVMELLVDEGLKAEVAKKGQADFAFTMGDLERYRVNIYKQKGNYAAALRRIEPHVPDMDQLGLPREILEALAHHTRGLILVTGPTGCGKSTSLAAIIEYINKTRQCHILTLEDPIEYIYSHNQSMINQREIGSDTESYESGLRSALREDPDVILLGEMRDIKTISTAITAAETGHLVLSTLHTLGASQTIDRMVDVFPPFQQEQIKTQLASILKGVMSQQLLPRADQQGRVLAYEMMLNTPAISNLIREGKTYQISSQIQTGRALGMETMDASLLSLYKKEMISLDQAMSHAFAPDEMKRRLKTF